MLLKIRTRKSDKDLAPLMRESLILSTGKTVFEVGLPLAERCGFLHRKIIRGRGSRSFVKKPIFFRKLSCWSVGRVLEFVQLEIEVCGKGRFDLNLIEWSTEKKEWISAVVEKEKEGLALSRVYNDLLKMKLEDLCELASAAHTLKVELLITMVFSSIGVSVRSNKLDEKLMVDSKSKDSAFNLLEESAKSDHDIDEILKNVLREMIPATSRQDSVDSVELKDIDAKEASRSSIGKPFLPSEKHIELKDCRIPSFICEYLERCDNGYKFGMPVSHPVKYGFLPASNVSKAASDTFETISPGDFITLQVKDMYSEFCVLTTDDLNDPSLFVEIDSKNDDATSNRNVDVEYLLRKMASLEAEVAELRSVNVKMLEYMHKMFEVTKNTGTKAVISDQKSRILREELDSMEQSISRLRIS